MLGIWFTQDLKECEAIYYHDKFDEVIKLQNMAPKNDTSFGKSFKGSHSVQMYSSLDITI